MTRAEILILGAIVNEPTLAYLQVEQVADLLDPVGHQPG